LEIKMPSISIPATVAITEGLADVGIGAATAGAIASVAGPAVTFAGVGALTAAATGGDPGQGALWGGLGGGVLGGLGAAFPGTMSDIGLGQFMGPSGYDAGGFPLYGPGSAGGSGLASFAGGAWTPGPEGFPISGAGNAGGLTGALSNAAVTGLDPATLDAYGVPSGGGAAASTGSPLADASAGIAKQGSSGFNLGRGLLSAGVNALGSPANQRPNYGLAPGPSTTAATRGPYFDKPLQSTGYLNREAVPNYQPQGQDWYHWGQVPGAQQPQFFRNNQLTFAKGGPLSFGKARQAQQQSMQPSPFDTAQDGHVDSDGGDEDSSGVSDSIPARLSQDEYVLTAADVSRLGNGSSTAGARKLDKMRTMIARDAGAKKHQGKVKSPMHYARRASR
jgi:hypothetical protein